MKSSVQIGTSCLLLETGRFRVRRNRSHGPALSGPFPRTATQYSNLSNRPRSTLSRMNLMATCMTFNDRSLQSYGSEGVSLSVGVESIGVAL